MGKLQLMKAETRQQESSYVWTSFMENLLTIEKYFTTYTIIHT